MKEIERERGAQRSRSDSRYQGRVRTDRKRGRMQQVIRQVGEERR